MLSSCTKDVAGLKPYFLGPDTVDIDTDMGTIHIACIHGIHSDLDLSASDEKLNAGTAPVDPDLGCGPKDPAVQDYIITHQ